MSFSGDSGHHDATSQVPLLLILQSFLITDVAKDSTN